MLAYFTTQIDLWWICFIPYVLMGAAALPILLMGLFYGWLQIFLIFIGLVDAEMIQKNFAGQLLKKVMN